MWIPEEPIGTAETAWRPDGARTNVRTRQKWRVFQKCPETPGLRQSPPQQRPTAALGSIQTRKQ